MLNDAEEKFHPSWNFLHYTNGCLYSIKPQALRELLNRENDQIYCYDVEKKEKQTIFVLLFFYESKVLKKK